MAKQVYFVVAVEFDEDNDNKPEFFIDEGRADAVFDDECVWDTEDSEWQSIDEHEEIHAQAMKFLNEKFGA
jgi:hypothetical protein